MKTHVKRLFAIISGYRPAAARVWWWFLLAAAAFVVWFDQQFTIHEW